jgi:hypothetical protein
MLFANSFSSKQASYLELLAVAVLLILASLYDYQKLISKLAEIH